MSRNMQLAELPSYYAILPVERILHGRKWSDLRPYADEIGLAVLLDFYFRRTGQSEVSSYRRYALEDFLASRGVERPSELGLAPSGIAPATYSYVLADVCVPEVIDLMTAFPTSRSVQEERRAVYALLAELTPEHATRYRDEIARITTTLMLDEGVRLLDQSRIFVDKDGVVRWAERELKESFDRYRSLYEAHVGFDAREFMVALTSFIETQQPIPEQFLGLRKGEADKLLLELISQVRDNFLLSRTHGLDAFLSMRVRHGTLSGMLRGPLEQNHIINQRGSGSGRYQRDPYWSSILQGVSSTELAAIELAIIKFSERFDDAVDDLRNRLQIRRKDRPDGLFEIPLIALHVYWLRQQLSADVRIEDFITACVELFWMLLDNSLHAVQNYIAGELRTRVGELFATLAADLLGATPGTRHQLLNDAVHAARTQVQAVMDSIRGWFQRAPTAKRAYPIGQAIDVALEAVRITYRNFMPIVNKEIDTDKPLMIALVTLIGDIVFTAMDNVYRHSGVASQPNIAITVKNHDEESIDMTIESEVAPGVNRTNAEAKLKAVRDRIARGEYQTMAVTKEGGTGLMKLKSLVDPSGRRDHALDFGFTTHGTFRVSANIRLHRSVHENMAH